MDKMKSFWKLLYSYFWRVEDSNMEEGDKIFVVVWVGKIKNRNKTLSGKKQRIQVQCPG